MNAYRAAGLALMGASAALMIPILAWVAGTLTSVANDLARVIP